MTSVPANADAVRERLDALWHVESRRELATLVRLLGDCHWAKDGLVAAFTAALEPWTHDGVPAHPRWIGVHDSVMPRGRARRARARRIDEFGA